MPSGKRKKIPPSDPRRPIPLGIFLTYGGIACIALSFAITLSTFWPVIREELGYSITNTVPALHARNIIPVDRKFGIVIPKIGANAVIVPDVNPYDSREYQVALTRGVAHAKGTAKPGSQGNVFLFSHSSVNFYEATRYNSVFYLLSKLEDNDTILLYFDDAKYTYRVTRKNTVSPKAVEYLTNKGNGKETVTLMTCWPPGTTYKRLIVSAERI